MAQFTVSQNIVFNNYHLAWKAVTDAKSKTLKEAYGLLLFRAAARDYYIRSNCLDKFVGFGSAFSVGDNGKHTCELQWDQSNKNKGWNDLPFFVRYGAQYTLANKTRMTSHFFIGKEWVNTNKVEVPVSKEIKVVISDQCDVLALVNRTANYKPKFGFELEFKA